MSVRFIKNNKIKKEWLLSTCRSFYTLAAHIFAYSFYTN